MSGYEKLAIPEVGGGGGGENMSVCTKTFFPPCSTLLVNAGAVLNFKL